jgi:hypothetical protein
VKQIRLMQQWQCGWTRAPVLEMLNPPVFAVCDDDDYDYLIRWLWYGLRGSYAGPDFRDAYAVVKRDGNTLSARRSLSDYRILTMQRVVMFHQTGDWSAGVYHCNRNSLDNRYENLTRNPKEMVKRSA